MEIKEDNLFYIDFETGGLKSYYNGVCSCTIKKHNSKFIKNFIFYPQKAVFDYMAFKINGLSLEELYKNGSSREEIIKTIVNIHVAGGKMQNYIIFCGWNVNFDIEFLLKIYKEKHAKLPCPIMSFDLLDIAKANLKKKDKRKKIDDGLENFKLTTVYQHYFKDFDEEKAHTAEYDCYMVEMLYDKFKELKYI